MDVCQQLVKIKKFGANKCKQMQKKTKKNKKKPKPKPKHKHEFPPQNRHILKCSYLNKWRK